MKRRDVLKGLTLAAGGALCSGPTWKLANAQAKDDDKPKLATAIRGLIRKNGKLLQPIRITVQNTGGSATVVTKLNGVQADSRTLTSGNSTFDLYVEPVTTRQQRTVSVSINGAEQTDTVELKPVRKMRVYILPHSHHDLGFTDLQANVEEKQMQNITRGIELARKTAEYPEGSRFVWNLEVLWGADMYMQRRSEVDKAALVEAVQKGWIGLNGSYANELTGLCRPEELLQLFRYGTLLGKQCNVKVDSAMMSDVPGFSWGTVDAMAQAGIRYFSAAPNYFDRIGTFMVAWQDKPFWWISRSGKEKILFWVPWTGYAMSHIMKLGDDWVDKYQDRMDSVSFPYDISYVRWSGHGDNAVPDPDLSEFARHWNETYEWPKFTIASTSTAFSEFEKHHGDKIPKYSGDLTPYWEDGAASSALETAMSRNAADRISQASALAAILSPSAYTVPSYTDAWKNVLLYSEHTWGAWSSISDSENPFTLKQWDFKRAFAVDAQSKSKQLLSSVLGQSSAADGTAVEICNSTSWDRTEVVLLSADMSKASDHVADQHGQPVSSQRLSSGELAVLVTIPAYSTARYTLSAKKAHTSGHPVSIKGGVLQNASLRARIDAQSGDIVELNLAGDTHNLVDTSKGALNRFLFMEGVDVAHLQRSGTATLAVEDHGPLVATVRITSSAPSCNSLTRRVRLVAGQDYLDITNIVDKKRAPMNPNPGKDGPGGAFAQHEGKESIQFAFPFAIPGGKMTMDLSLSEMQPEVDQLPGSCKNWIPIGRWIDISAQDQGVTWATLDAPLVELGGITANLPGSQKNPDVWIKHLDPTQNFYSWVMNNHWSTNYRAYQEGPVAFRYALRPHRAANLAEAARFATGLSQPLLAAHSAGESHATASFLRVAPADVLVETLKPSDDGKAWIARLFGASGEARNATLTWAAHANAGKVSRSNLAEEALEPLEGAIPVAGWDLVTLRIERT